MRQALLPTALAALVVAAGVLAVAFGPGVLASPGERPAGDVGVREVTVQPTDVSGETVTLGVRTYLMAFGGSVENVSLRLRATSLETGFVEATTRVPVGSLDDGERAVDGSVTVPRDGGYRLEAILYRGDERVQTTGAAVRGVGALTPAYARTPVRFHRFGGSLPAVEFRVASVEANRTTLNVSSYLTNTGDEPSGELRVVLTARQAESNIVAARESVRVSDIRAGRTATPSANLTVPDDYNYYLDATLWRDGVVVGSTRSAANLAPTRPITVNETTERVDIDVGEFTSERESPPPTTTQPSGGTPGFTPLAALAALALGLLWRRYR